jgi:hypothetical protein
MSEDELRAIEVIVSEMIPGPWRQVRLGVETWLESDDAHVGMTTDWWHTSVDGVIALRNAGPALIAEVRRLRAALEVYADGENWLGKWNDTWIGTDGHRVARATLKGTTP